MGGLPIMALSVLGMPVDKLPSEQIKQILQGGVEVCQAAGIPLAGVRGRGRGASTPKPWAWAGAGGHS